VTAPNPAAGKPVDSASLVNVPQLVTAYFASKPDPSDPTQRVAFGTSGHRGTSLKTSFNENHILATTQAICDHRRETGLTGPLFVGIDTHALAEPALVSAVEVFAANGVDIMIDERSGYTPTPVISHAILSYNKGRRIQVQPPARWPGRHGCDGQGRKGRQRLHGSRYEGRCAGAV
jgi:phosphoglucomutase